MIDNKSLHHNDKNYTYSQYCKVRFCEACRYFLIPGQLYLSEGCCPHCGHEPFKKVAGRYKVKIGKKKFLIFTQSYKVPFGFTPKIEESLDTEGKGNE